MAAKRKTSALIRVSLVHDVAEISRRNNAPFLGLAPEVHQPGVGGQRADQLGVLRVHGVPFLVGSSVTDCQSISLLT